MSVTLSTQLRKLVGSRTKAVEAPKVLLGRTKYVDDIQLPGIAYLSFARSSLPHANLKKVDTSRLSSESGVIAALTGKDIIGKIGPFPIFAAPRGLKPLQSLPMAVRKVKYVGEIVAAIVSKDRYGGEDAVEMVDVEYEPLEVVLDPEKAAEQDSFVVDEWGSNRAYSTELIRGNIDSAFSKADVLLKEKFRIQRQYGAPMETRGVVANYDSSTGSLTIWSSTQWPHIVRTVLSQMLCMGEHKIRVIAPDVGGGFGNKQDVYPEEILAGYLAIAVGKPLKWVATRSEDLVSTVHGRDQVHHVEVAATSNGIILGVKDRIVADLGAFHIMSLGPQLVSLSALQGPYGIKNWAISLECNVTNKTPVGAYRGFGQSEANFVIERSIDLISQKLKLDPIRVRLRNLIQPGEFPYATPLGAVYDSGNYPECLARALRFSDFEKIREKQKGLAGDGRSIGIGLSFGLEASGVGPSKQMGLDGFHVYSGFDSVTVKVDRSGSITVLTGLSPHGQGLETTLAQVCADEFGLPPENIVVTHGDTESSPYGFGTWGSRSALIGSAALKKAADKVKEKGSWIAAHALKVPLKEIGFSAGNYFVVDNPRESISILEVARKAYDAHDLPPGVEPGLEVTCFHDPPGVAYSYSVHVPVVEVETDTGRVQFLSYKIVHDCGVVINPGIVEGQIHGGVAQGIAGALLEELAYDSDGQLQSPTFIDYLLPTATDIPDMAVDHMETPTLSAINPFGIKGMAEGGTIAPSAAIASAIENALQDLGVRVTETPITPEKLRALMKNSVSKNL